MEEDAEPIEQNEEVEERVPEVDPILKRLMTPTTSSDHPSAGETESVALEKTGRPEHLPDIASLFTDSPQVHPAKDNVFEGLETHEIRSLSRASASVLSVEHRQENADYEEEHPEHATEVPNNALEDAHTIGPYDSSAQDYQADQADQADHAGPASSQKDLDDDSSTVLPEAEPSYRYNIKVRSNGKVLDPPSK